MGDQGDPLHALRCGARPAGLHALAHADARQLAIYLPLRCRCRVHDDPTWHLGQLHSCDHGQVRLHHAGRGGPRLARAHRLRPGLRRGHPCLLEVPALAAGPLRETDHAGAAGLRAGLPGQGLALGQ